MALKKVLVIGGSFTGIQVATDLANRGYKVDLVEKRPSLGERIVQIEKTFPSNDATAGILSAHNVSPATDDGRCGCTYCSICFLPRDLAEFYYHPNVNCMTYSEVVGVEGKVGNFKVKVRQKARYVDPAKCTMCGKCLGVCPVNVPSDVDMGMTKRKAIYLPYPNAVPNYVTIDSKTCLYLKDGSCKRCEKACPEGAIVFKQTDEVVEINVGAIVVATGLSFYDMKKMPEYGYGKFKNVITAMEYERLVSVYGPTKGKLLKPSDSKSPKKIAFIHCAGSRNKRHLDYCSGVCCMHSVKEAVIASERDPNVEPYMFYIDMRVGGKGFYEYLSRAKKTTHMNLIRAIPGRITQSKDGGLLVWYDDLKDGKVKNLRVDMVVLAQGLMVPKGMKDLFKVLGIQKDKWGFAKTPDPVRRPQDTTVPGIVSCGFSQAPMDIPMGIAQASGAAGRVSELLEGGSK